MNVTEAGLTRLIDDVTFPQAAALEATSALAAIGALVTHLGPYLAPFLPALVALLVQARLVRCIANGVSGAAAAVRAALPSAVPARLLLPAVFSQLHAAWQARSCPLYILWDGQ